MAILAQKGVELAFLQNVSCIFGCCRDCTLHNSFCIFLFSYANSFPFHLFLNHRSKTALMEFRSKIGTASYTDRLSCLRYSHILEIYAQIRHFLAYLFLVFNSLQRSVKYGCSVKFTQTNLHISFRFYKTAGSIGCIYPVTFWAAPTWAHGCEVVFRAVPSSDQKSTSGLFFSLRFLPPFRFYYGWS